MSALVVRNLHAGGLRGAELRVEAGLHVILATVGDGAADLVRALSGTLRPARGRVLLDGRSPHRDPSLRRRIASLLADEPSLGTTAVESVVKQVAASLGQSAVAARALDEVGMTALRGLPHSELTSAQRRSLALGIALAVEAPRLVVLHEPLWAARGRNERVAERLVELGRQTTVVACTASTDHASRLGGTLHLMRGGVVVGKVSTLRATGPGAAMNVRVSDARRFTARLAVEPSVHGVRLDASTGRVAVVGGDLDELARVITSVCTADGIELGYLAPARIDLAELRGAATGAWAVARGDAPPVEGPERA